MTDIPRQCKELFDRLMKGQITQEEFDRQIRILQVATYEPDEPPQRADWAE